MQLNTATKNNLKTNSEVVSMNFSIGDASVVIDILRNRLYEHKIRTLVQEYISNARDANNEAKSKHNIEVTVPNALNPVFKVRDFGLGIDPDRMQNVFVMYGASTKRGTNEQIGGFGIGAKSAWSYTDSFTITTWVGGQKRVYVAHTGTSNMGRLDLVSTTPDKSPNGTEIQVAVNPKDVNEFKVAIIRATMLWSSKVTYKGVADQFTYDIKEMVLNSSVSLVNDLAAYWSVSAYRYSSSTEVIVSIDGIPYELDSDFCRSIQSLHKLQDMVKKVILIKIGNGVLEVAASRESVVDNAANRSKLESIAKQACIHTEDLIRNSMKSSSIQECMNNYVKLNEHFRMQNYQFGSYTIGSYALESTSFKQVTLDRYYLRRAGKLYRDEKVTSLRNEELSHLFILKGKETLKQQGAKVREYLRTNKAIVIMKAVDKYDAITKEVEKDLNFKDFASLPVPAIVKMPSSGSRMAPMQDEEFCIYHFASRSRQTRRTTLNTNQTQWVWLPVKEGKFVIKAESYQIEGLDRWLRYKGYQLGGLSERSQTLVKNDKNFIKYEDFLKKLKLTKEDITSIKDNLSINADVMGYTEKVKDVADEFLADMIAEYKALKNGNVTDLINAWAKENVTEVKEFVKNDVKLEKLISSKYPLLKCIDSSNQVEKELELYINLKHSK